MSPRLSRQIIQSCLLPFFLPSTSHSSSRRTISTAVWKVWGLESKDRPSRMPSWVLQLRPSAKHTAVLTKTRRKLLSSAQMPVWQVMAQQLRQWLQGKHTSWIKAIQESLVVLRWLHRCSEEDLAIRQLDQPYSIRQGHWEQVGLSNPIRTLSPRFWEKRQMTGTDIWCVMETYI